MSGAGPLSLGQLSVWHDIRGLPAPRRHEPNNAAAWPLPPGVGAEQVRTALRAVAARHPSLRTRYDLQDADAPGQLPPDPDVDDQLRITESAADEPARLAAELATEPFDLGREHAWRARLLTHAGTPAQLLFVKHHIAADAWAQELLHQEFRRALIDPRGLGPTPPGPADLAAEQYGAAGLRRQAAALDHWAQTLTHAPSAALPRGADTADDVVQCTLRSAAARPAAHTVAERARVSVASVVLAAYARSVARRCGVDALVVQLMSANRFAGRWRGVVTSMNQWVPALIADARNDDLVKLADAVHWSGLGAFRHGMHDVTAVAALRARMPEAAEPACAFNYVSVPDDTVPKAAPHQGPRTAAPPTLTWEEPFTTIGPRCYARAVESEDALSLRLTAKDLDRAHCAELLWDLHESLLTAAGRP
ncbi:condensation domain-containing protein [Streptomyces sp. BP-8]|uniref:Condensation domain-containing protein n=1 Tax=Streptomyces sirii TaxID=3127701 RepID=A0ABZ2QJK9_9ACTN